MSSSAPSDERYNQYLGSYFHYFLVIRYSKNSKIINEIFINCKHIAWLKNMQPPPEQPLSLIQQHQPHQYHHQMEQKSSTVATSTHSSLHNNQVVNHMQSYQSFKPSHIARSILTHHSNYIHQSNYLRNAQKGSGDINRNGEYTEDRGHKSAFHPVVPRTIRYDPGYMTSINAYSSPILTDALTNNKYPYNPYSGYPQHPQRAELQEAQICYENQIIAQTPPYRSESSTQTIVSAPSASTGQAEPTEQRPRHQSQQQIQKPDAAQNKIDRMKPYSKYTTDFHSKTGLKFTKCFSIKLANAFNGSNHWENLLPILPKQKSESLKVRFDKKAKVLKRKQKTLKAQSKIFFKLLLSCELIMVFVSPFFNSSESDLNDVPIIDLTMNDDQQYSSPELSNTDSLTEQHQFAVPRPPPPTPIFDHKNTAAATFERDMNGTPAPPKQVRLLNIETLLSNPTATHPIQRPTQNQSPINQAQSPISAQNDVHTANKQFRLIASKGSNLTQDIRTYNAFRLFVRKNHGIAQKYTRENGNSEIVYNTLLKWWNITSLTEKKHYAHVAELIRVKRLQQLRNMNRDIVRTESVQNNNVLRSAVESTVDASLKSDRSRQTTGEKIETENVLIETIVCGNFCGFYLIM